MKNLRYFKIQDTPFTGKGNIAELFGEENTGIWGEIVKAIDALNENAIAI